MAEAKASSCPRYSVIVPAHDEEATIARTLSAFAGDTHRRIIVVCNACDDRTAEKAREAAPHAEVIEMTEGGKWRAINEGLEQAGAGIVLVVDADVEISGHALDTLAARLAQPGVLAVSPGVLFELDGADRWVRSYHRVFARHSYLGEGVGGAGVYGLSVAGRAELGLFPPLISDDGYVRMRLAARGQKRVLLDIAGNSICARVRPPRTLGDLLRTEARWRRGDRELAGLVAGSRERSISMLWGLLREGRIGLSDAACFVLIKLAGRLLMLLEPLRPERTWEKDLSSRNSLPM